MKWLVVAGSVTEAAMTILNDTGNVAVKSTRENTVVSLTHTLLKDAFQTGCHSEAGPYCSLLAPPPIRWTDEYEAHSPYVVVETGTRPFWVAEGKPLPPDADSPLNPPHKQFKPRHWSAYQRPNGLPVAATIYDDLAVHSTPGAEEKLLSMSLAMHSQSHAIERQIDVRRESLMEALPRPERPPPTFQNRIKVTRLPGVPRRKRSRSRVFVEKRVEVTQITKGGGLSPRAQSAESRVSITNLRWTGRALLFLVGRDVWPGLTKVQGLHANDALLRQGVSLLWRGHWQVSSAGQPLVLPSFVKSRPFPDSSTCLRITSRTSEIWFSKPVLLSGLYIWLEDVNTSGMLLVEGIPFQESHVDSAVKGNPSGHSGTADYLGFENVSKGWKAVLPFNEFHRRRVETQPLGGGWMEVTSLSDQAHVSRIGSLRFQFLNEELKGAIPRTRDPPEPPAGFYTFPNEERPGPAFLPFSSDSVVHEKPRVCFGGLQVNVPVPLWQMDWTDIDNVTEEREVLRAPRSSHRSLALSAILARHKERDAYNAIPSSLPATLVAVSDNKLASARLLSSLKSGSQHLWVPRPPLKSAVLGVPQPSTVEGLKRLRLKQREAVRFEDDYLKNFYPRKTKAFPSASFQPISHSDAFSSRPSSGLLIHHGTRLSADQITFIGTHVPLESPVATLEELRRLRRGLARTFGPWTLITSINLHHAYARFIGAHTAKEVYVVAKLEALFQSAAQDALTHTTQQLIANTHLSLGGGEIHEALNAAFTDMVSAEIRRVLSENSEMIAQVQEADIEISALDPAKMVVGVSLHAQLEDDNPITLSLNVDFSDVIRQIFFDEQSTKRAPVVSVEAKPVTLKMVTDLDPAMIHSYFEDEKTFWAENKTGNLYIENGAPKMIDVDALDSLKLSSLEVESGTIVELIKQLLSSEVTQDDLDPSRLFEFLGGDTIIGQPDSLAWSEWLQENVVVGPLNEDL